MSRYRLYTRTQGIQSFKQCFIVLDLTRMDFPSSPPLSYYVEHWYVDADDLIDFLLSVSNERITLIVSDLLADITCHILRRIFPQTVRIIIVGARLRLFGNTEQFHNVQSLVDNLSSSLRDQRRLCITFDFWPVERTSHDLNKHTAKFLSQSYFYTILSQLTNTEIARSEFLECVEVFYSKQSNDVKTLCEEFKRTYHSKDIIKWYTRPSFFYLLLNRTLRSQDINHIFAMRYVIFDLENHLRKYSQQNSWIGTVYRGQQMHSAEIKELEANVAGLIGLTAFWSTSRSRETAFDYTVIWPPERTDSVEGMLFSINIPSHVERAVYLDIS